MKYSVNMGHWCSVFAVPTDIIDKYIKTASGSAIKVLIFLLRYSGNIFDSEKIASETGLTNDEALNALDFWKQARFINNTLGGFPDSRQQNAPDIQFDSIKKDFTVPQSSINYSIKPDEIAEKLEKDNETREYFKMAVLCFQHELTYQEQKCLLWMNNVLGLNTDVCLQLISYCASIKKLSPQYINTLAIDWEKRNIDTCELAKEEIARLNELKSLRSKFLGILGLDNRPITKKEDELITHWIELGHSEELVNFAYEKTVNAIGNRSLPYMAKILDNWYAKGLHSVSDVTDAEEKSPYKGKKKHRKGFIQDDPSFDVSFADEY